MLLHEDPFIRDTSLRFLHNLQDLNLLDTKNLISSIQQYGLLDAFKYAHMFKSFPLDEPCIQKILSFLEECHELNHACHLLYWLIDSKFQFNESLLNKISDLPDSEFLTQEMINNQIQERINISQLNLDSSYTRLKTSLEGILNSEYLPLDLIQDAKEICNHIIETEDHEVLKEKTKEWLWGSKFEEEEDFDLNHYYTVSAIYIAGKLCLTEHVDKIIECSLVDWDYSLEIIAEALKSLGSNFAVAKKISNIFFDLSHTQQLFISETFESNIYPQLHDFFVKLTELETSFIPERGGIYLSLIGNELSLNAALKFVNDHVWEHGEISDIIELLYTQLVLRDINTPYREKFKQFIEERNQQMLERMKEFLHFDSMPKLPIKNKDKIGRNDPCPCGSGKKYKKCCLK